MENNNRLQLNRIGLLNFWYYDEQDFELSDGKLLLKGSNGSGKSVTMQSFIPLLFDGNKSPRRLDPFGSSARKLDNYLLDEENKIDDRTGYLYMEFKQKDLNKYITIGMGIHARKNKPLDVWYFIINDNRRIHYDLNLYNLVAKQKVVLTKKELENALGSSNFVTTKAKEYMAEVNKHIFGFNNIDAYSELIELLIQLRSPKLSKEFKPTVLNEILSTSLQALSDQDLQPMSEAIETMDNMKTELEQKKMSYHASKKIKSLYDKYNQVSLYQRASTLKDSTLKYNKLAKTINRYENELQTNEKKLNELDLKIKQLEEDIKANNSLKDSLSQNEAFKIKQTIEQYTNEVKQFESELDKKETNQEDKDNYRIDLQNKIHQDINTLDYLKKQCNYNLKQLLDNNKVIYFDEIEYLNQDFSIDNAYDFSYLETQNQRLWQKFNDLLHSFKQLKQDEEEYEKLLTQKDQLTNQRNILSIEKDQLDKEIIICQDELNEKIIHWHNNLQTLTIDDSIMQSLHHLVNCYTKNTKFKLEATNILSQPLTVQTNEINNQKALLNYQKQQLAQALEQLINQKETLENQTEPIFAMDDASIQCRKYLDEHYIPYLPLYRAINFKDDTPTSIVNAVEEAMAKMGILNALVVSDQYKAKILAQKDLSDQFLFTTKQTIDPNLMTYLTIDYDETDMFFNLQLEDILSSIGVSIDSDNYILANGQYRHGIVTGTITHQYQSKYIGALSRERYKQEQILLLVEQIKVQTKNIQDIEHKIDNYEQQLTDIQTEISLFPTDEDLSTCLEELVKLENEIIRFKIQIDAINLTIKEQHQKIITRQNENKLICSQYHILPGIEQIEEAMVIIQNNTLLIAALRNDSKDYLNTALIKTTNENSLAEIIDQLDELKAAISNLEDKISLKKREINQLNEQLNLTDFHELEEKMNKCIYLSEALPKEKDQSSQAYGETKANIKNMHDNLSQEKNNLTELTQNRDNAKKLFDQEYQLEFTDLKDNIVDLNLTLQTIISAYHLISKDKKLDKLESDLFQAIRQNEAQLQMYDPRITKENSRTFIRFRYEGNELELYDLLYRVENEIYNAENLIKDKDREIFEDILSNTISAKIRYHISTSEKWVTRMNSLMNQLNTSSNLKLNLKWQSKKAESDDQLNTDELVTLLRKDKAILQERDYTKLSNHFRSRVTEARKRMDEKNNYLSFFSIVREILDYRQWFEFEIIYSKDNSAKKVMTNNAFFQLSGGEKAMSMYMPLFSAVIAKYGSASPKAPLVISLDEAFAGVDEQNIGSMFKLMIDFDFDFIINSQILWGDYDTVDSLEIYELYRPTGAQFITTMNYHWDGKTKVWIG